MYDDGGSMYGMIVGGMYKRVKRVSGGGIEEPEHPSQVTCGVADARPVLAAVKVR
jgi:hypothetical protein